jgi:hypothetical protein
MMVAMLVLLGVAPTSVSAIEAGPTERPGSLTPSQLFGGRSLTPQEAQAACGPAAAVAFARAVGRMVSLDRAVAEARAVGWTPTYGMSGPWGQLQLLRRLNVPATLEAGINVSRIAREVQAGRPVIIRTGGRSVLEPGHYFVAERYDAVSGRFDLAQSALVLRSAAGRRWFTLNEITGLGTGTPTHTLFIASTGAPAAAPAPANTGSVTAMSVKAATSIGSLVVQTGGLGARLRAAPGTDAKVIASVADGSKLVDAGASQSVAGRIWRKVSTGGVTAWIDGGLLR